METKEIKITPPEGYEIDKENSTFECIKFKLKSLTYEDIAKKLFYDKEYYFLSNSGYIINTKLDNFKFKYPNNATSKKQLEKLLAINKLMNVAKHLNGNWKPNWNNRSQSKFFFEIEKDEIMINDTNGYNLSFCYFKSRHLVQQAIDILGEDTIRLALSTDW